MTATRSQRADAMIVFASLALLSTTAWILVRSIAGGVPAPTPTHVVEAAPPVIDVSPLVVQAPSGSSEPLPQRPADEPVGGTGDVDCAGVGGFATTRGDTSITGGAASATWVPVSAGTPPAMYRTRIHTVVESRNSDAKTIIASAR